MARGTHRPEFRAWSGGSPPPKKLPADAKKLADELYEEQLADWREGWGDEPDTDTKELFRKRARYDAWATYRDQYEENPMARKENPSTPYHVYAEDGFESVHRTLKAAKTAAKRGSKNRRMRYEVVSAKSGSSGVHSPVLAAFEDGKEVLRKENRSCPPGEIRRKGYKRKGYTRKDGTRVAPTKVPAACIEDQGEPGKGPKVFTIEDEGDLGGPGYTDKPTKERQRLMRACVKRKGYRSCLGKLQALAILGKNTWPKKKLALVERDRKWLVKTFGGPGSFGPQKNPNPDEPGMTESELLSRLKF